MFGVRLVRCRHSDDMLGIDFTPDAFNDGIMVSQTHEDVSICDWDLNSGRNPAARQYVFNRPLLVRTELPQQQDLKCNQFINGIIYSRRRELPIP